MTKITRKYKLRKNVFGLLSSLCVFGPFIGFGGYAFTMATMSQKLSFSVLAIVALVLGLLNILFKYHFRCMVWLLLIGCYICLKEVTVLLIILAGTSALDDFVFSPIHKASERDYQINKQIDRRGLNG